MQYLEKETSSVFPFAQYINTLSPINTQIQPPVRFHLYFYLMFSSPPFSTLFDTLCFFTGFLGACLHIKLIQQLLLNISGLK